MAWDEKKLEALLEEYLEKLLQDSQKDLANGFSRDPMVACKTPKPISPGDRRWELRLGYKDVGCYLYFRSNGQWYVDGRGDTKTLRLGPIDRRKEKP